MSVGMTTCRPDAAWRCRGRAVIWFIACKHGLRAVYECWRAARGLCLLGKAHITVTGSTI
eukprot:6207631-Pleurochrysis_carterae.AAC.1